MQKSISKIGLMVMILSFFIGCGSNTVKTECTDGCTDKNNTAIIIENNVVVNTATEYNESSDDIDSFTECEEMYADARIDEFGVFVGEKLLQKVAVEEGRTDFEVHLDTENLGCLGAENLRATIKVINSNDEEVLVLKKELTGYIDSYGYHTENILIEEMVSLNPGKYIIKAEIHTSTEDVNKTNNYTENIGKNIELTIKGECE